MHARFRDVETLFSICAEVDDERNDGFDGRL